jgi:hypothetical protein
LVSLSQFLCDNRKKAERKKKKKKEKKFLFPSLARPSSSLTVQSLFLSTSFLFLRKENPPFPFPPFFRATMPLYQVAIPAIVLAHVIGLALLLYSLEKVSGIVSRTTRRLSWKKKGSTASSASAAADSSAAEAGRAAANHSVRSLQPSPSKSIHNTVKTKGWVRGCACTVSLERERERGMGKGIGRKRSKQSEEARASEQPCLSTVGFCLFADSETPVLALRLSKSAHFCSYCSREIFVPDRFRAELARVEFGSSEKKRAAERIGRRGGRRKRERAKRLEPSFSLSL